MFGVLFLFLGGVLIGGLDVVDRKDDRLWFLAQVLCGPVAIAADLANQTLLKPMPGNWMDRYEEGDPAVTRRLYRKSLGHVNEMGTLNVLIAAKAAGARKVVLASSAAVYGDAKELPVKETATLEPLSPYAVSKIAGEHYCKVYHQVHGLGTISLRFFNVYGPRQDPGSEYAAVIPKFITRALGGKALQIFDRLGAKADAKTVKAMME